MYKKIALYTIKDDYVNYIQKFDEKVCFNKQSTRPYVGVVFDNDNIKYFAPLTSPKLKHKTMFNSITFMKIDDGNLGIVNLNNMIPVPENALNKIDINSFDNKYEQLLINQFIYLDNNKNKLFQQAEKLHYIITKNNSEKLKSRCCNFSLLEEKCKEYQLEYIKQHVATTEDKEKLLEAQNIIGQAPNIENLQSSLDKITQEYKKIENKENELKIMEHKFNKANLYLSNITELENKKLELKLTDKILNKSKITNLENTLESNTDKFQKLGFKNKIDFTQQYNKFKKNKSKFIHATSNNKLILSSKHETLIAAKETIDHINHMSIKEYYKEVTDTNNWDITTTSTIQNLNEKNNKIHTYKELKNNKIFDKVLKEIALDITK